jgi:hypothetical protein
MTTGEASLEVNAGIGIPEGELPPQSGTRIEHFGLRELDLYGVKGCNSPYQPLAIPKSRMLTGIQVHWSSARAKLTRFCCSLRMDVGWGADQGSMQRRLVTLAYLKARVY